VRYSRRDVIDAIRYVARNGCVWRTLSRIHDTCVNSFASPKAANPSRPPA
jgi:transposase